MKTHTLHTVEADPQHKQAAFINAKFTNAVNKHNFTNAEIARAYKMQHALEMVYDKVYEPNFRKTKISIKCIGVKDRKPLRLLEAQWAQMGVTKAMSAQGFLYSFS